MTKCSMERIVAKAMPTDYQIRKSIAEGVIAEREMEEDEADRRRIETEVRMAKKRYGKDKGCKEFPEKEKSHMDDLIMLGEQFGIIKKERKTDVYQVIRGTVIDANWFTPTHTVYINNVPQPTLEIRVESNSPVGTLVFDCRFPIKKDGKRVRTTPFHGGEEILAAIRRPYGTDHYYINALHAREIVETIKVIKNNKVVATYQNL